MLLNVKLVVISAAIMCVMGISCSTYSTVYNKGKAEAEQACAQARIDYENEVKAKINQIEANLSQLSEANATQSQILAQDITKILSSVKKQPVTIIKDGKCIPSQTFVNSINQAVNRANSK